MEAAGIAIRVFEGKTVSAKRSMFRQTPMQQNVHTARDGNVLMGLSKGSKNV